MAEKSKNSVWSAGLVYGAILGAVSVIISVIFYILGKTMSDAEKYVSMGVMVVLLVYFLYLYRQERLGGYIKYGSLIGAGAVISAVAGLISAAYFIVFIKYIDPSMQNLIDEKSLQKMLEQLAKREIYPSQTEIDDMLEKTKMFRSAGFMAIGSVINITLIGTLISLIVGIFLKKESKDPFASVEEKQ